WIAYSGLGLEETANDGWLQVLHPDDLAETVERWEQSLAAGRPFELEYRMRRVDGAYRWHLARTLPTRTPSGELAGWVGTCTDIDDRRRAEDAKTFLVEASALLGSSLDYESSLAQAAELAVPRIADWCVVDVLEEDGSLRPLGAFSCVAAESGRRFEEDDLRLAEDFARRAATAIDNAELYREAEERAQATRVLASVGDGVFMVDAEGLVRLWNPAAEAITG